MGFASKFKRKNEPEENLSSADKDGVIMIDDSGEEIVIKLSGKIDVTTSEASKDEIMPVICGKPVVLDIEKVTYVSSAGMRMFFEIKKACDAENTTMEVRNIRPNIHKILQMAGYSAVLNLKILEE